MRHPVYSYVNIASVINFSSTVNIRYMEFFFIRKCENVGGKIFNLLSRRVDYDHVINMYPGMRPIFAIFTLN